MCNIDSHLKQRLKALEDDYRKQLPERMRQIEILWHAQLNEDFDPDKAQQLYLAVHKISGSGATFGYSTLSAVARTWEILLKEMLDKHQALSKEQFKPMSTLLEQLIEASNSPTSASS